MHPGDGRTYRDVEDIPGNIYWLPPIYKVDITYNVFVIKSSFIPELYRRFQGCCVKLVMYLINWYFEGAYCLHLQGKILWTWIFIHVNLWSLCRNYGTRYQTYILLPLISPRWVLGPSLCQIIFYVQLADTFLSYYLIHKVGFVLKGYICAVVYNRI